MSKPIEMLTSSKKVAWWIALPIVLGYGILIYNYHNLGHFLGIMAALVILHEMGHFYAAKMVGVQPKEFGVGFGRIIARKETSKNTVVSFRLFPFGGFVRFDPEETKENSWSKNMWILAGGPLSNLLTAVIAAITLNIVRGYNFTASVDFGVSAIGRTGAFALARFKDVLFLPAQLISQPLNSPTSSPGSPVQMSNGGGISNTTAQIAETIVQDGVFETLLIYFIFFSVVIGLFQLVPLYGLDGYQMLTQTIAKIGNAIKRKGEFRIEDSNIMKAYGTITMSYLVFLSVIGVFLDVASIFQ